jgi:hypothetical protein
MADLEHLLDRLLPRRDVTKEKVIFQLEQRHIQRQKTIGSHIRRQRKILEKSVRD